MRRLCAPTNFDDALVRPLAEAGAYEAYGKLTEDAVGGGRPSHVLPPVGIRRLREHVGKLHAAGVKFNYLLNASAMGGVETTGPGYRSIRKLLDLLAEITVDSVTVSNPVLLQLVKRHYPGIEVKASAFANVVTVMQARAWADMGADVITASPVVLNRELKALREMASAVKAGIQVILNNNCIQSCAFYGSHANLHSHSSQKGHWSRGYMIDYCLLNCRGARLANPGLYVRGDWIRPEDQQVYEDLGVTYFKVVNRTNPTPTIIERVNAYAAGRFDGNLVDLVEHGKDLRPVEKLPLKARVRMAFTFVRPRLANPNRLREFGDLALPSSPMVTIDNRALDGFIDFFKTHSCMGRDCAVCTYCDEIARKVVKVDGQPLDDYRRKYQQALDKYLDGYYFRWGKQ
jgi:collagenase-like PrtC family protease